MSNERFREFLLSDEGKEQMLASFQEVQNMKGLTLPEKTTIEFAMEHATEKRRPFVAHIWSVLEKYPICMQNMLCPADLQPENLLDFAISLAYMCEVNLIKKFYRIIIDNKVEAGRYEDLRDVLQEKMQELDEKKGDVWGFFHRYDLTTEQLDLATKDDIILNMEK